MLETQRCNQIAILRRCVDEDDIPVVEVQHYAICFAFRLEH